MSETNSNGIMANDDGDCVGLAAIVAEWAKTPGRKGKTKFKPSGEGVKTSLTYDVADFSQTADETAVAVANAGTRKLSDKISLGAADKTPGMEITSEEGAILTYVLAGLTQSRKAARKMGQKAGAIESDEAAAARVKAQREQALAIVMVSLEKQARAVLPDVPDEQLSEVVWFVSELVHDGKVKGPDALALIVKTVHDAEKEPEPEPAAKKTRGKGKGKEKPSDPPSDRTEVVENALQGVSSNGDGHTVNSGDGAS